MVTYIPYTEEELKMDVEEVIGIRAKDIEKIVLVGKWHVRFRAFKHDFYYWYPNNEPQLKEEPFDWTEVGL